MDLIQELRQRVAASPSGRFECARGGYRLSVLTRSDDPKLLRFTICDWRPRGWWPVAWGRITPAEAVVPDGDSPADPRSVELMLDLLLSKSARIIGGELAEDRPIADYPVTSTVVADRVDQRHPPIPGSGPAVGLQATGASAEVTSSTSVYGGGGVPIASSAAIGSDPSATSAA